MKTIVKFLVGIAFCLSLTDTVKAQDNGTYADEMTAQDSTYVQDIFISDEEEPASNQTVLYIVIAVVIIGGGYLVLRKKKK